MKYQQVEMSEEQIMYLIRIIGRLPVSDFKDEDEAAAMHTLFVELKKWKRVFVL